MDDNIVDGDGVNYRIAHDFDQSKDLCEGLLFDASQRCMYLSGLGLEFGLAEASNRPLSSTNGRRECDEQGDEPPQQRTA